MNPQKISHLEEMIRNDFDNLAGIIVRKNGKTLYENYFNECSANDCMHIFSVTKSIVSILFGIAIDKGYIKSLDQKVLDFFPSYKVKRGEKTIQSITIKEMLTMTAPYKYKSAPYTKYFTSDDWVKSALDLLGGKGQIGEFRYAPLIGPDILSGILTSATGQTMRDFATENLFSQLGIKADKDIIFKTKEEQLAFYKAKNISGWVADPKGVNTAGWGLALTATDMANIGQLYLDGGMWNGKQIVSSKWIDESTKEHSRWEQQGLPYGYLWWVIDEKNRTFAAIGDGGNVIYVNTKNGVVISIVSLFKPRVNDRIKFIREHIEPFFQDVWRES
ncbi:MAG: serine hydrolase domain-containing protein [Phocaeicola sp.]